MPAWATGRRGFIRRGFGRSVRTWVMALLALAGLALFALLPEARLGLDGTPLV